jgi:hypothetical protein
MVYVYTGCAVVGGLRAGALLAGRVALGGADDRVPHVEAGAALPGGGRPGEGHPWGHQPQHRLRLPGEEELTDSMVFRLQFDKTVASAAALARSTHAMLNTGASRVGMLAATGEAYAGVECCHE